ncbi:MAG: AAA family ATPase [Alphaproteobacteria bacterium]|nr:AAA family ATPase [Alphaproteobacteria bacterium]
MRMSARPPTPSPADQADQGDLTLRQQEILALVRAGKGNKDIANELGIGLGTVKQHVVALFRKLNVASRAEAITRSTDLDWQAHRGSAAILSMPADDSLIELRPTCILSVGATAADGGPAGEQAWRALNRTLSALAAEHDCTLVALPGIGIDVLFGLHRVGEHDVRTALAMAQAVALQTEPGLGGVRAGLASGFLVASMHRHGGWTGESVAGHAIARARDLRDGAAPGTLRTDTAARRLLAFTGLDVNSLAWLTDDTLGLTRRPFKMPPPPRPARPLVNRIEELLALRDAYDAAKAAGTGMAALVEGEAGMGKSALCEAFVAAISADMGTRLTCRAGADSDSLLEGLVALGRRKGRPPTNPGLDDARQGLERALAAGPALVFVDDSQRAPPLEAELIALLAETATRAPLVVLIAARRLRLESVNWSARLRMTRLAHGEIAAIIAAETADRLGAATRQQIADLAEGVPLFAVELARSALMSSGQHDGSPTPPMSLVTLVLSRIDSLGLHRGLLRLVSRADDVTVEWLKSLWPAEYGDCDHEVTRAVEGGVLKFEAGRVAIRHPLVREVLKAVLLAGRGAPWAENGKG